MPDEKETTATIWHDNHSGKRGHQLMTRKLADAIPALGANANVADCDDILAHAKLFSPYSNWTWYITELDAETGQCFGLVEGFEREIGYFDLTELAETTVFGGVPAVERDLYWEPKTLGEIKGGSRGAPPHGEDTERGDAMIDEPGTEDHSPDVVSAEEFLFGVAADDGDSGTAGEQAADVEATEEPDVDGEFPITDAADDAVAVVEDEDCQGEAAQDSRESDDAGEQPAPGETGISEELKVVLSIRGNRATIGVQQPSADPHIESFDDPDLSGLAREVPAVVERARARWEDEPMHPDHERPAPPARRQRRREQPEAQTETAQGEAEPQPQPETLRLF